MPATTIIIIAVAILAFGAYLGFVAVVSIGIRHEESLFRERRRLAEEESAFLGRPVPYQGFMDTAPDPCEPRCPCPDGSADPSGQKHRPARHSRVRAAALTRRLGRLGARPCQPTRH